MFLSFLTQDFSTCLVFVSLLTKPLLGGKYSQIFS